jgi:hypothetical protein
MAYNIFLKSLRSLDEFRKNPHIKIPPKSPCINFQSPNIFKIQFLFRDNCSFNFQPKWPNSHPAFLPRAAKQDKPAHQAMPPFPFLPPSPEPAASPPPLTPPRHGLRAAPLPRHGATPTDAPSLTRPRAFTQS